MVLSECSHRSTEVLSDGMEKAHGFESFVRRPLWDVKGLGAKESRGLEAIRILDDETS